MPHRWWARCCRPATPHAQVLTLLLFARVWTRPLELLLPAGLCCLLLATSPQFLSYIALVRRLDGDVGTSIQVGRALGRQGSAVKGSPPQSRWLSSVALRWQEAGY